ncbi:NEDD8 ultimate buster 1-like [Hyposmocoma kahamanoa]|uniref:NEDD8 ultimate buster 1-like n=1 Tax=Hyposmocoma kahamanoa TaxID=1477025 RepID=UPI000E6D86F5|nr:NEDD8 ultimate buster 1-like [Hyposmocoma kahamanoa]
MDQDTNLQHEDLLIRLRGKLNDEKIKLWEPPYVLPDNSVSQSLQDLAKKYATELSLNYDTILTALHELQLHSLDRFKANDLFKETGYATLRIKATLPGERPKIMKVQKKLDMMGSELIQTVATEINVEESRVKLIFNGKVIKPTPNLEEQGVRNGVQIMALIMAENPEEVKKEDTMYMEMKSTRDDAMLLSECIDDVAEDDDYMKLEDQAGNTVQLPPTERRSLLVGLALHERGRAALRRKQYPLALVLYLEADRMFNECRSSLLKTVDNWALLQLDIAWCYLCLQSLQSANDAAARLARAEESFRESYGENHQRLIALKGTAANERVLMMRLYLLQGIVAYHQNQRAAARQLLERAEAELGALRVDEAAAAALLELGWSPAQARGGLRAARGDVDAAHHLLCARRDQRDEARRQHAEDRQARLLGVCLDGSAVNARLVDGLVAMGYGRRLAVLALRNANNHVSDAVRLIQDQPDMLVDSEQSSEETETPSSDDSAVEPDSKLLSELEAMGYVTEEAKTALRVTGNRLPEAADLLLAGGGHVAEAMSSSKTASDIPQSALPNDSTDAANPSTSSGAPPKRRIKRKVDSRRRKARQQALDRLSSAIDRDREEDDHLDTSLVEEEEFLVQYKSLL